MSVFADLVERLADLLHPLFAASATAAAIVVFTALVRLAVHPLSRSAARGHKARARLAPELAALREKHGGDRERLQKATTELYARQKVSPLEGCLPSLLQLPAFFLMYHLFSSARIGGEPNGLLDHTLFDAPLGGRWADALSDGGVLGGAGLVYLALFGIVAAVATFTYLRTKRQMAAAPTVAGEQTPGMGAMLKVMPLMPFATLITVAVVPLAAALYVVTSTTWSAVERVFLYRDMPVAGALATAP
ncbi:YidC/Oxa1 family membrane protein insertase [Streptomyces sp. PKU-EA00015]|uniref:YidC/Oxa1 family membrane protein insertase n=1 Tax=Streptomyces sp. PKU-EA00015 TaxID=2748326 RepID=UPI0015A43A89|nr:YidC/Oxa1 family membrane protein insertase [Streptomyces sp. PKU-EA00015]NWF30054.1 YidC/Oxa1 family membrane protein insertase [Streptomyces sp. PKU-EA00015]